MGNPWDEHAEAYRRWIAEREAAGGEQPVLEALLGVLGDLRGQRVLDAGCGEGYLARALAARGATVTGIDVSARLVGMARAGEEGDGPTSPPVGAIDYRVADLTRPLPELAGAFDAVGSHLVLNDVPDHRGFAATLAALIPPGGRVGLAFNNPYSFLWRGEGHVTDYFASGARGLYGGMSKRLGGEVRYHHRTLEEYLDAFLGAGLRLVKLIDVRAGSVPPMFMVLAFEKS